jgi:hypothetical protein
MPGTGTTKGEIFIFVQIDLEIHWTLLEKAIIDVIIIMMYRHDTDTRKCIFEKSLSILLISPSTHKWNCCYGKGTSSNR